MKDLRIFDDDCETDVEALTKGIEALEKQISKKPITEKNTVDGADDYLCPNCNCGIYADSFTTHCICGQALDWSDNNV